LRDFRRSRVSALPGAPFGGYKQSGNGREGGLAGLKDFMEMKAISGLPA
jgi:aldehyde dehydrogenase (NAD+)